jgi:glycosyltransferase involved in cell wall biosynthesis
VRVSVIVPVKDAAALLERTLPALVATLPEGAELVVSDDGSRDASGDVAARHGARVVRSDATYGPAAARNRGARAARGEALVFLDADVRVHAETLSRLLAAFRDPDLAAAFGSYDAAPEERTWVSLYKNLAHHFVHQRSAGPAGTFWAGCGAIRAEIFAAAGGFDERYRRPSIEDVELGYRLTRAGRRIQLLADVQVTHLKRWTLASLLVTDLRDRAIPWARLVRAGYGLPRSLNFSAADRAASACVALSFASLAAAPLAGAHALVVAGASLALAIALDGPFLAFALRRESAPFALAAGALQIAHRAAGLVGLAVGLLLPRLPSRSPAP